MWCIFVLTFWSLILSYDAEINNQITKYLTVVCDIAHGTDTKQIDLKCIVYFKIKIIALKLTVQLVRNTCGIYVYCSITCIWYSQVLSVVKFYWKKNSVSEMGRKNILKALYALKICFCRKVVVTNIFCIAPPPPYLKFNWCSPSYLCLVVFILTD